MSPKASTRLLATQSDERLAAMARAGHDRAFEALVQRYRRPLLRYCRRISISDGRAEDVVQQTLLQAWSALRRGAQVRELRPWLYRIAHNTAVNLARTAARDGGNLLPLESDGDFTAESAVVEPDLAGGLVLRDALTDMAALPQMQREVIFRTALAGHSHEEVATALGITDGAVRGLLYRARASLRTAITALTPPPMLAWMLGTGQGVAVERAGELAAGGGGVGLGVLLKGSLAVLTAGTLITGAAIVHNTAPAHRHARPGAARAGRETAGLGAPSGSASHPGGSTTGTAFRGSSSVPSASRRSLRGQALRLHVSTQGPRASARSPHLPPRHASSPTYEGSAPTSTTLHIPAPAGASPPSSSGSSTPSAPSGGSSGAAGGSSGGGITGSGGSGGSGTGGSGTGSGGSGTGSGGGGSGSGSGGSGTGSGGSGTGTGGSGTGTGGGGAGAGGGTSESTPSPPSGSGSPSTGPVGTVVHEVTGLLEHTVHGVLGHTVQQSRP